MAMKGQPPRRYVIPAEPIRRVMREWLERETKAYVASSRGDEFRTESPEQELIGLVWPDGFTDKGVRDNRRLNSIMDSQEWIDFDLADRILTRLGMNHLWATDDDLRAVYESVDLDVLDIVRPTCDHVAEQASRLVSGMLASGASLASVKRSLRISHEAVMGLASPDAIHQMRLLHPGGWNTKQVAA